MLKILPKPELDSNVVENGMEAADFKPSDGCSSKSTNRYRVLKSDSGGAL